MIGSKKWENEQDFLKSKSWTLCYTRHMKKIFAGLELAAMSIPQVLGYAKIAGMPIETGLYTLVLPLITFAALGSSQYLVVAADSATAAILAGGLAPMATAGSPHYIALAGTVALLTGLGLLLARILKLGFLADFLSQTVLIGFLTGVGIQLAVSSCAEMLGLENHSTQTVEPLVQMIQGFSLIHAPTALLSAAIVISILVFKKWLPRVPGPLIAVVGGIIASKVWDFSALGIATLGTVQVGLPHLGLSEMHWQEVEALIPLAASCCVMILAQSAATARFYAFRHQQELNEDQDLVGLSVANFAASLSGTFVVNGSPSQTAMVETSGGRRPWSHLTAALIVAFVLLFMAGPFHYLQYLPRCVLNSIIFILGLSLVDGTGLRALYRESPGEFTLALATIAVVVYFGVEKGILLAAGFSMLRILWHSYHPHTGVLIQEQQDLWRLKPVLPGIESVPGLVIYRFGAALFYANAGLFAAEIRALAGRPPSPIRWIVIDAEAISQMDYSAAQVVLALQKELKTNGVELVFARVAPYLRQDMDRHHVTEAIGADRYFFHLKDAREAFEKWRCTG